VIHYKRYVGWLLIILLVGLGFTPVAHARISREDLDHALYSTVLVYTLDDSLSVLGSGSGSIVDERGLILTNYHVVGDPEQQIFYNNDRLVAISITRNPKRPAVPAYLGEIVNADADLDLALIRVLADLDGNDLNGCQVLPTYEIGDSDKIQIGDDLAIFGYPGIGGESITFTKGTVSGYESEADLPEAWMKTDAEINPGNSGGSAVAEDGTLIGIPTAGVVDEEAAGKLGLIRPINFATPLLENLSFVGVAGCDGTPTRTLPEASSSSSSAAIEQSAIKMLGFTLNSEDETYLDEVPNGTQELYGNFEYQNISAESAFKSQWRHNGRLIKDSVVEFDEWPLDAGDGVAFVSTSNENGFEEGTYKLEIKVGDLPIISDQVIVDASRSSKSTPAKQVLITAQLISADSGRPIGDATFVILAPGITWDTFDSNKETHIHDLVFSDSRGHIETSQPVSLEKAYSIGIFADGYQPVIMEQFVPAEYYEGGNYIDLYEVGLKRE